MAAQQLNPFLLLLLVELLLKKGRLSKLTNDTEQNLALAPSAFWTTTLKSKLLQLLEKKTPRNTSYESDETNIVVSVTDRSQRDPSQLGPSVSFVLRPGRV